MRYKLRTISNTHCIVLGDEETRPLRWSSLCSRHVQVSLDGSSDDKFVFEIERLAKEMPRAILIPADVEAERIVNRVLSDLTIKVIPFPDLPTLEMLNNKWRFHEFCIKHEFRVPFTRLIASKQDLQFEEIASELGLPLVVKPIDQRGSGGVRIVHNKASYDKEILNNEDYQFAPLIVQSYVSGVDMGIDVFSMQGKVAALAIQQKIGSKVSFTSNAYMEKVAYEFCQACCYNGVMNIDVRREDGTGKIYLFEANPRFWGSLSASVWCGLNFVAESIEQKSGSDGVRKIMSGQFEPHRHPILRPNWWPRLVFDRGVQGRMLRAMMFDPYLLPSFIGSIPLRLWKRFVGHRAVS